MKQQTAIASFQSEIDASKGAPEWVHVFPAGPEITARDGRRWKLNHPQQIIDNLAAHGGMLSIDWEHAKDDTARLSERRPAAGWIKDLSWRDDGMWARVEWSERGRADIESLAYRYISPTFVWNKATREIVALKGAGLVNRPALLLQEIASLKEGTPDMDKDVLAALGLGEDACASDAVAAINALKTEASTAAEVDPKKFVPRADLEAAHASLSEANAKVAAFEAEKATAAEAALDAAVDAAVAGGKFPPSSKEHWLKAAGLLGLEEFQAMMEATASIVSTEPAARQVTGGAAGALSAEEAEVCRLLDLDPSDFAKSKEST